MKMIFLFRKINRRADVQLSKAQVAGMVAVLLTGCGSGEILYEKTDVHLILPCYQNESVCLQKMTDRCVNTLSGRVMESEIREEDVPVAYVVCRPPQTDTGDQAGTAN